MSKSVLRLVLLGVLFVGTGALVVASRSVGAAAVWFIAVVALAAVLFDDRAGDR